MLTIKKTMNLVLLAGVFTSTVLSIAPGMAGERNGFRGDRGFTRIDTNADGVVSIDELTVRATNKAEKLLERKDADSDSVLSLSEFQRKRGNKLADYSDLADEILLCVADSKNETGNDNIIVPDVANFLSLEERFAAADSSGDGFLDLDEITTAKVNKATVNFSKLDKDNSGTVTKDEFKLMKEARKATKRAVRQCIVDIISENETF